jgi:hypothetical protein
MSSGHFIQNSRKRFREIQNMPFGKERRTQLLLWLQTQTEEMSWHIPYGFIVNRKHQLIVNRDPDLQHLIKKGILIQINKLWTSRTSYNYLVLADKYNKIGTLK